MSLGSPGRSPQKLRPRNVVLNRGGNWPTETSSVLVKFVEQTEWVAKPGYKLHFRAALLTATTPAAVLRDFILTYSQCKWHFGAMGMKFTPEKPLWTRLCHIKCFRDVWPTNGGKIDQPKASSLARWAAFTTALMSVTRSLPSSNSMMPSMVQPAGVVTASLSRAG